MNISTVTAGGVTHILHGNRWVDDTGDRTGTYLFGDRIDDPLAKGDEADGSAIALNPAGKIQKL
jgi:hypothetical protein